MTSCHCIFTSYLSLVLSFFFFFFFNDTATTEIYTLSLHDALPTFVAPVHQSMPCQASGPRTQRRPAPIQDRKSTRLNSSHLVISYAVFCLKKKKKKKTIITLIKKNKKNNNTT